MERFSEEQQVFGCADSGIKKSFTFAFADKGADNKRSSNAL